MPQTPNVWILLDDRPGNQTQVVGVAEALGWGYTEKRFDYGWFARLPNLLRGTSWCGLKYSGDFPFQPPWPDVVLSVGRRMAPFARRIKRESGGKTFLCHFMGPDGFADQFDLLVLPTHDKAPDRPNQIRTLGSPHRVSAKVLADWRGRCLFPEDLPRPWIAVSLGGSNRHAPFTAQDGTALGEKLASLARQSGGSLLISTSRRTDAAPADALEQAIQGAPHWFYRWTPDSENPYFSFLANADALVVTEDSVAMMCEATATGKPVYIAHFLPQPTFRPLIDGLMEKGMVRPLGERLEIWDYAPNDAAGEVAGVIRARVLGAKEDGSCAAAPQLTG